MTALDVNVYDAALDRVRFVYDNCDDVIVSMSGGKDSTVVLHLARIVAAERGRLPLKVHWLDQEAEWQATEDYVKSIMYAPDVEPFWYQIPFRLTNSLSHSDNYLSCWDPAARDIWIREQDPISIKINPLAPRDRFHYLIQRLPSCCGVAGKEHVGVLVGVRMAESLVRKFMLWRGGETYKGIKWCHRQMKRNTRVFWPIYDFTDQDVWACIAKNRLPYNRIYDAFYRYGMSRPFMRCSALIHETAYHQAIVLQEVEPRIYERYLRRVPGASTSSHLMDDIIPHTLPAVFPTWRDYRDYLLEHLVQPQYQDTFRARWKNQHGDWWYQRHAGEVAVNDTDGTKNVNSARKERQARKKAGVVL